MQQDCVCVGVGVVAAQHCLPSSTDNISATTFALTPSLQVIVERALCSLLLQAVSSCPLGLAKRVAPTAWSVSAGVLGRSCQAQAWPVHMWLQL